MNLLESIKCVNREANIGHPGFFFAEMKISPLLYEIASKVKIILSEFTGIEKSIVYNFNPRESNTIRVKIKATLYLDNKSL